MKSSVHLEDQQVFIWKINKCSKEVVTEGAYD